jgi:hypothetical protein
VRNFGLRRTWWIVTLVLIAILLAPGAWSLICNTSQTYSCSAEDGCVDCVGGTIWGACFPGLFNAYCRCVEFSGDCGGCIAGGSSCVWIW